MNKIIYSSNEVMTRNDFEKQNQGWIEWGASMIKPSSWFQGLAGTNTVTSNCQLIHIPALQV